MTPPNALAKLSKDAIVRDVIAYLRREHGLSPEAILASFSGGVAVPATILQRTELGPLEAIVKYLREERLLRPVEIARLTGRDPRVIAVTYQRAVKKMPDRLTVVPTPYAFPVQALQDETLSVLEHIALYLKTAHGLTPAAIARITGRDPRTIGTVLHRAKQRRAGGD